MSMIQQYLEAAETAYLLKELRRRTFPVPGAVYRHFKGDTYKVLAVGPHASDKRKMVAYRKFTMATGELTGDVWIRDLSDWCSSALHGQVRFERIDL